MKADVRMPAPPPSSPTLMGLEEKGPKGGREGGWPNGEKEGSLGFWRRWRRPDLVLAGVPMATAAVGGGGEGRGCRERARVSSELYCNGGAQRQGEGHRIEKKGKVQRRGCRRVEKTT